MKVFLWFVIASCVLGLIDKVSHLALGRRKSIGPVWLAVGAVETSAWLVAASLLLAGMT